MLRITLTITIMAAILPATAAIAQDFRFPDFQPEPTCGDSAALTSKEHAGFGNISGASYLAHYRHGGTVKEMRFRIETPGAFLGDDFPSDICGSTVVLSLDGGPDIRGVLEYLAPVPGDERPPWPYAIKLEWPEKREMRFSGSYFTAVWGAIEMPAEGGGFERVFFTGARADRWD